MLDIVWNWILGFGTKQQPCINRICSRKNPSGKQITQNVASRKKAAPSGNFIIFFLNPKLFYLTIISNNTKNELSYDMHKFKYSSQEKFWHLTVYSYFCASKWETFLATVFELMFVIPALVFKGNCSLRGVFLV